MKNTEIEKMECNGYAYFNRQAFLNKSDEICYIPENTENDDDFYTYKDLKEIVSIWAQDNQYYLINNDFTVEEILNNMYFSLTWEFPETYLNELNQ